MYNETAQYLKAEAEADGVQECKARANVVDGCERDQVYMQEKLTLNKGLFSVNVPKVSGWLLYLVRPGQGHRQEPLGDFQDVGPH